MTTKTKPTTTKKSKPAAPAPAKQVKRSAPGMSSEMVPIAQLKYHAKNYREHPDDQLLHIMESIKANGFYRNVVIARDRTILAGHGVVKASQKLGLTDVPVVRMNLDPNDPRAIKLLIGDNEIGKLGAIMDGQLNELLKDLGGNLVGTGFDEAQVSALLQLTRPPDCLIPHGETEEWEGLGLPGCDPGGSITRMMIQFRNDEDREKFVTQCNIEVTKKGASVWSAWWPPQGEDGEAVKWVEAES